MLKLSLLIAIILLTTVSFAQMGYKKVYKPNDYKPGWTLVKSIAGTYGFIDENGKELVPPIYKRIEKFEDKNKGLALVQNVSDAYGYIDTNGKEVIPAIYSREEAEMKLQQY